jgi:hypothetical protein
MPIPRTPMPVPWDWLSQRDLVQSRALTLSEHRADASKLFDEGRLTSRACSRGELKC